MNKKISQKHRTGNQQVAYAFAKVLLEATLNEARWHHDPQINQSLDGSQPD
jgi:hypothetical protein